MATITSHGTIAGSAALVALLTSARSDITGAPTGTQASTDFAFATATGKAAAATAATPTVTFVPTVSLTTTDATAVGSFAAVDVPRGMHGPGRTGRDDTHPGISNKREPGTVSRRPLPIRKWSRAAN